MYDENVSPTFLRLDVLEMGLSRYLIIGLWD